MAEEFDEFEVMFRQEHVEGKEIHGGNKEAEKKKLDIIKNNKLNIAPSLPVNIPGGNRGIEYGGRGGDEFVPPHLIIRQRLDAEERMEFSVCIGRGRTLKGRDLSQVRNSILFMTGFHESS